MGLGVGGGSGVWGCAGVTLSSREPSYGHQLSSGGGLDAAALIVPCSSLGGGGQPALSSSESSRPQPKC